MREYPELDSDSADDFDALQGITDDTIQTESERYRGASADPAFGFVLAIAMAIGLIPLLPESADLRYTIAWGSLAGVSVLAWLLGNAERIGQETPENVAWGIGFGFFISLPFALFLWQQFANASALMFPHDAESSLGAGTILAYLVFVMPLAETLFFRGLLQRRMEFYVVGVLSGVWSLILFFPVMWGEILSAPAVGIVLALSFFVIGILYSYVRERNGLAAAWITQIVTSVILFFFPFLTL